MAPPDPVSMPRLLSTTPAPGLRPVARRPIP